MQSTLIYLLYRLVQVIAFPLLPVYALARGIRDPRYFRRLGERFGVLPHSFQGTEPGAVWLHAVSVGEVVSSLGLVEKLRSAYPARRLFVSAATLAGRSLAEEKLGRLADGVFYAPVDYRFAIRRVLRTLRPSVVVVMETEIWPNWYREVKRTGAGLLIVNGRISDRAFPGYRRLAWFFRPVLEQPDTILAQSAELAGRYRELGAPAERVRVGGNLKYDFDCSRVAPPAAVVDLVGRCRPREIWIAASTMPPARPADVDEDDAVMEAFRALERDHPGLLLMLVPRRPARFEEAAAKLRAAGVRFLRRSRLTGESALELPGILLVDTIGELAGLFPLCDVVFMGGTLAERGGHNILEPAFFERAIVMGPHMENFTAVAREFEAAGAAVKIGAAGELAAAVGSLLGDPARRRELGAAARRIADAQGGATERAANEVAVLSARSIARLPEPWPARAFLWPLAQMWRTGSRWKRGRDLARRRRLGTPVVSIGGLGVGGAGKTPAALHLAGALDRAGLAPAVLTRGYRRRVPEKSTVLPAGAPAPAGLTGDEGQLYLRAGGLALGIGADRYVTGRLVEERFRPGVILLDDGFQHWKLARDVDLVLIDALDPFGGGAVFPLGRLREDLDALGRADAFLVTRVEPGSPIEAIEAEVRRWNPHAPIFRSRVVPRGWVDAGTGEESSPDAWNDHRSAAFCGLANPGSFWRTLAGVGCRPVRRWSLPDHHHYRPREFQRMAWEASTAGATVLLTTEKDLVNLPPKAADLAGPLRLLWLRIGIAIERERELLALIGARLLERGAAPPRDRAGGA